MARYYSTMRPIDIGTYPKPKYNKVLNIVNFGEKKMCEEIGCEAWGYIEYAHALNRDFESVADYDLVVEIEEVHTLKYLGKDRWSRRVYEDEEGRLWKDVDCSNKPPLRHNTLYRAYRNGYDAEPDYPMGENEDYIIEERKNAD